ncbi:MAG: hypothetical protein PVG69_12775 [Desulfobacterales bacterium]
MIIGLYILAALLMKIVGENIAQGLGKRTIQRELAQSAFNLKFGATLDST